MYLPLYGLSLFFESEYDRARAVLKRQEEVRTESRSQSADNATVICYYFTKLRKQRSVETANADVLSLLEVLTRRRFAPTLVAEF